MDKLQQYQRGHVENSIFQAELNSHTVNAHFSEQRLFFGQVAASQELQNVAEYPPGRRSIAIGEQYIALKKQGVAGSKADRRQEETACSSAPI